MKKNQIEPSEAKGIFIHPTTYIWAGVNKRIPSKDRHFIQYVGSSFDLLQLEQMQFEQETGRVSPLGYGTDE
jgi:hypothetical protein